MSFPRYPRYKDSGVEWLGEVPEHWTVVPVKQMGRLKGGSGFPHENQGLEKEELDFHKVSALGQADGGDILQRSENAISRETAGHLRAHIFPPGTIVLAKVGAALLLGRVRTIARESCLDNNLMGLIVDHYAFEAKYVRFAMSIIHFDLLANPGAVPSLSETQIGAFRLPAPPRDEQMRIASFVVHEAAKIDRLIVEQRRLIELLKEKRKTVISDAVTKGLDPDAPMKPSGVEWLGDVPAEWCVASLGTRYHVQLGKMLDSSQITGAHLRPYLRVADVQWGAINTVDLPLMDFDPTHREKFALRPGDLLVNEGGSYVGRSAIWDGQIEECYYQKALHRVRPHCEHSDSTNFLLYIMFFATSIGVFVAGGNQNTIDHLPAEKLKKYRFAFPPYAEQVEIAAFLDELGAEHNKLVGEAERAIALLQERRAALISAAVTGKIDVRGLAEQVA